MLNLLPEQDKKRFITAYRFKFAIMCTAFACLLLIAALIGLFPSYLSVRAQAAHDKEEAEREQSSGPSIEQAEAKVVSNKVVVDYVAGRIATIQKTPPLSELLQTIFEVAGPTITVEGVNLSGSILTIRGVAATRDDLILFHQDIKKEKYFATAILPISDIAKSTKAQFTIQIVLPQ